MTINNRLSSITNRFRMLNDLQDAIPDYSDISNDLDSFCDDIDRSMRDLDISVDDYVSSADKRYLINSITDKTEECEDIAISLRTQTEEDLTDLFHEYIEKKLDLDQDEHISASTWLDVIYQFMPTNNEMLTIIFSKIDPKSDRAQEWLEELGNKMLDYTLQQLSIYWKYDNAKTKNWLIALEERVDHNNTYLFKSLADKFFTHILNFHLMRMAKLEHPNDEGNDLISENETNHRDACEFLMERGVKINWNNINLSIIFTDINDIDTYNSEKINDIFTNRLKTAFDMDRRGAANVFGPLGEDISGNESEKDIIKQAISYNYNNIHSNYFSFLSSKKANSYNSLMHVMRNIDNSIYLKYKNNNYYSQEHKKDNLWEITVSKILNDLSVDNLNQNKPDFVKRKKM